MSSIGLLHIKFTDKVLFTEAQRKKFVEIHNSQTSFEEYSKSIEVYAVKFEEDDIDELLMTSESVMMPNWKLVQVTENGVDIQCEFSSPLQVSSGDRPDTIYVQLKLSSLTT